MNEFVFSIESIFCGNKAFCSNPQYYIAPYQRGYKWAADNEFDQVPQLLNDTYEAYRQKTDNYFLQFITVQYDKQKERYEVIDGQQRLTTLSLLFYVLATFGKENIAKDKVVYSRYDEGNVFDSVIDVIMKDDESRDTDIETQDFYYLVRAGRCIRKFLRELEQEHEEEIDDYIQYISNNVKIILNIENEFTTPEEVFMNLNDNRVPLSDIYLVKGLLLTLAVRRENTNHISYSYEDIMSQRMIMGRMWDEIYSWFSDINVSHYFFKEDNAGMTRVLEMAIGAIVPQNGNHDLFNLYNAQMKNAKDAFDKLQRIKHIYLKLKDIYEGDSVLYNMLGYAIFSKSRDDEMRLDLAKDIIDKSTRDVKVSLAKQIREKLPKLSCPQSPSLSDEEKETYLKNTMRYDSLRYKSQNYPLTNLLLAFSVFPESQESNYRFDFCSYDREKWSFEHISPQHPKSQVKISEAAIGIVIERILELSHKNEDEKTMLIEQIKNGEKVNVDDIDFLYDDGVDLHSLGNMALLSKGENSALSNNPYIAKRNILFNLQNNGNFVPRHTMDVFNKVLNTPSGKPFESDIHVWTNKDITAHIAWMEVRYTKMMEYLDNIIKTT